MLSTRVRTLALSTALALFGIGCFSDMGPTGIATPDVPSTSQQLNLPILTPVLTATSHLVGSLLSCRPQPYAADTEIVGRNGGRLVMGGNTLVIPAGALDHPVRIIGEAPSDTVVSVRFQPEGLQFDSRHTPILTLDYSGCGLVRNLLPKRIAYTTDRLDILSFLLSTDNLLTQHVSGQVHHFSRYAVAW